MQSVIIREQILSGLKLCGVNGCFLFTVLSSSSRFNNHVWINDPEGKTMFYLSWKLINPNEIVSLTSCNTVCGPEWGEITAQKPLICKFGTLHHPGCATQKVAEAASADAFH